MQTAVRRATIYEPVVSILDLHLPPEVDSPRWLADPRVHQITPSRLQSPGYEFRRRIETRKACFAVGADEFLASLFETEKLLSTMRRMAPRSLEFV